MLMSSAPRRFLAASLACGALLLSACSTDPAPTPAKAPPSKAPGTSAPKTSAAPSAAVPSSGTLPVLASLPGDDPGVEGLRLDVTGVVRATPTMWVLRARVISPTREAGLSDFNGYGEGYLGGGFADVKLVDVAGGHAVRVLQTAEGRCICTERGEIAGKESVDVFAAFPALPGDPASVIVSSRGFAPSLPLPVTAAGGTPLQGEPAAAPAGLRAPRVLKVALRSESLDEKQTTALSGAGVARSISSDVLFAFGKSDLTPQAKAALTEVAAELRQSATGSVAVVGHTDSVGEPGANQELSQRRAQSVVGFLTPALAGTGLTLAASGKGESEPVAQETGPERERAAARNRRVTLSYQRSTLPTPPPGPPAPAQSGAPLGTLTGSSEGPLTFRVDSLQRVAGAAVLGTFTVTNTGKEKVSLLGTFSERAGLGNFDVFGVSGLFLVDRAAGQRYAVVADDEKRCVCTITAATYRPLDAGESRKLYALLAAPPAGTKVIDLSVPTFAAQLRNLPLS